ncbi:MAG: ribonuclease III [Clostridia bacterium]|nr:ribonuclease III [Clostridia bacterium]MBQ7788116.1 ribonuclease III [Clostridia bacterium]
MSKYPLPIELLEKKIGYVFNDKKILTTALTHSSYANEQRAHKIVCECNERLEFLGDSVLSLVVSEYLFDRFKKKPEGELTKIRASVVCTRSLSTLANKIDLGSFLYLGKGEEDTGRSNVKILENSFEALLAAIYFDSKSKEAVAKFLLPIIIPEIEEASNDDVGHDYKTTLQQFIQSLGKDRIQYVCIAENGPDHAKEFEVEVRINSNVVGTGKGKTKREAEQNSAKEALALFDVK